MPSFATIFARTWSFIKRWQARIAAIVIGIALLIGLFGVPVQGFIVGVIAVVLFGIYETLVEINNSLSQSAGPKLYSLFQCKVRLQQLLAKARRTDTVAIVHVGLTMTEAWDYVRELLFDESSKPVNVDYRLLILADSSGKQSGWPAEVADWAQSVPASIAMIQRDLARAAELFKRRGQTLRFSVRQYDEVPVVHGWAIKQPLQAWHVGHCRWRGESYDWGGQNYVEIVGSSDDPLTQDIAELFDSYFDHLWLVAREVAELSYPREQATAA